MTGRPPIPVILDDDDWNLVYRAIVELPYRQAAPLLRKIAEQLRPPGDADAPD